MGEDLGALRTGEFVVRLVLQDIPRSPNGSKGLLRMSHWARSRYNEYWRNLVRSQIDNSHSPCRQCMVVEISQMRPRKLDRDNLAASCKPILDALVHWKLIKDDNEDWIDFKPPRQQIGKEKITIIEIIPQEGIAAR